MLPYSRGTTPVEYSLRACCETGMQMSLAGGTPPLAFVLQGVSCILTQEDNCLVVTATHFSQIAEARAFFQRLQVHLAYVCLKGDVAISIPADLTEPVKSDYGFMAEDSRCAEHGWPSEIIQPLVIPKWGACIYPEHEYVAIEEGSRFVPRFPYAVPAFATSLEEAAEGQLALKVGEVQLAAVAVYGAASRSTQWVWSFLLAVTALEMLALEIPSGPETKAAVKELAKIAKTEYSARPAVDLERIRSCLNQATNQSITHAVKRLVRSHCAPGIATSPLADLYLNAGDCDRKVAAIYAVRSNYVHEGRVKSDKPQKWQFHDLHRILLASLRHILLANLSPSLGADLLDDDLIAEYEANYPVYERLTRALQDDLSVALNYERFDIQDIDGRPKGIDSLREKIERKAGKYKRLADITDLAAARVTVYFASEIPYACLRIKKHFRLDLPNCVDHTDMEPNEFGYRSVHFVVTGTIAGTGGIDDAAFHGLSCEIQVRSLLEHSWAQVQHRLGYKASVQSDEHKRRFSRIAALLEVADREFVELRKDVAGEKRRREMPEPSRPTQEALTLESLHRFIHQSDIALKLDGELCGPHGFDLHPVEPLANLEPLFARTQAAGIADTQSLHDLLWRNRTVIERLYAEQAGERPAFLQAFPETHGNASAPRGLSVQCLLNALERRGAGLSAS